MSHHRLNRFYEGKELALDYDRYRPTYPTFIVEKIVDYLKRQNPPSSSNERFPKMLDVGCGGGKSTNLFASYFDSILGIDISEGMIEIARNTNRHDNVTYQLVHDNIFPVENNSVDLVNCATALHFMDLETFESECERVLKPNGCVVAYTYYPKTFKKLDPAGDKMYAEFLEKFMKDCKIYPVYFSPRGYENMFKELENNSKLWIDNLSFTSKCTLTSHKKMKSTLGDYRKLMSSGNKPLHLDPLDEYITNIRELLKCTDEEKELELTWSVPMFVFRKQSLYTISRSNST